MKKTDKEKLLDIIDTIKLILKKYELNLVVNKNNEIEIQKDGEVLTTLDSDYDAIDNDDWDDEVPLEMSGITFTINEVKEEKTLCTMYNYSDSHKYQYLIENDFIEYAKKLNDLGSDTVIKMPTLFEGSKNDLDMIVYRLAILVACYGAIFNREDYTKLTPSKNGGQSYVTTMFVAGLTCIKVAILGNDQENWKLVLGVLEDTIKELQKTKIRVM